MFSSFRKLWYRFWLSKPFTYFVDRHRQKTSLGDQGELVAYRHLLKSGWIVLARSYATEFGEVDLIAVDGETVVFVEVKTRTDASKGNPEDAVDAKKQTRISKVAESYIRRYELTKHTIRFDIVSIFMDQHRQVAQLKHFKAAFEGHN